MLPWKDTRGKRPNSFESWKQNTNHPILYPPGLAQSVTWNSRVEAQTNHHAASLLNFTKTRHLLQPRISDVSALEKLRRTRRPGNPYVISVPRFIVSSPAFVSRLGTLLLAMGEVGPPSIRRIANTEMPGANFGTKSRDF